MTDAQPTPDAIRARLRALAGREGVRVLYACESGSRAWGFPSPDSDFDIRFLYLRPRSWYLSIDLEHRADTLDEPVDEVWDLVGWDLRKALQLLRKSNPSLLEWLDSPIVYEEQGTVARRLRELRPRYHSAESTTHHYLKMCRNNLRDHFAADDVKLKRYFYVLRPLLAVRWIDRGLGPVPMEFARLVDAVVDDEAMRRAIEELLRRKRRTPEMGRGPKIAVLQEYIEREVERLESAHREFEPAQPDGGELDRLFAEALEETWGAPG